MPLRKPDLTANSVLVTIAGDAYGKALNVLRRFGRVRATDFFNVLVLESADGRALLERLHAEWPVGSRERAWLASVTPLEEAFAFGTREEFEQKVSALAEHLAPRLEGKSFHVRMHRRGMRSDLRTRDEEVLLDHRILELLEARGAPGRVTFEDPDAIVVVETLGHHGGVALWSRDEIRRWPLLHVEAARATAANPGESPREEKHAPIGPNATPELHGPPPRPPELITTGPGRGELPAPPTSAPERSGPVEPSEERAPPRPRPRVPEPHVWFRRSRDAGRGGGGAS